MTGSMLGLIWFAAFLMGHAGIFHFGTVRRRSRVIAALFAGAVAGSLASTVIVSAYGRRLGGADGESLLMMIAAILVMFSLFVLYMPFYYTMLTSLSVQTLVTVQRAPGSEVSLDQLNAQFASREVVQRRLDAMVHSGLLWRDGADYRLTEKGQCLARAFSALKQLWRLGPGG